MNNINLNKNHDLLFGVRRSIRYHNRRRMFFDRFHLSTSAISVIFGSATIFTVLSNIGSLYTITAAAFITILSAIDLVVGSSKMARLHSDLSRQFIELEKEIIKQKEITEDNIATLTGIRLNIEANEPTPLKVLDSICHNELLRAMGYSKEYFLQIKWYQRWLAQMIDINAHLITT